MPTSKRRRCEPEAPRPPRNAFTLIELLVVIAIIGVLAALLLPTLSRAKDAGRTVVCKNNLHEILIGTRLYLDDFNAYPLAWQYYVKLAPFVGERSPGPQYIVPQPQVNKHVWVCPEDARIRTEAVVWLTWYPSYGYNMEGGVAGSTEQSNDPYSGWGIIGIPGYGLGGTGKNPVIPTRENEILSPSDMIAFGDAPYHDFDAIMSNGRHKWIITTSADLSSGGSSNPFNLPSDSKARRAMERRHGGRVNIGFADGHVDGVRPGDLFTKRVEVLRRWNRDNQPHLDLFAR